MPMTIDQIIGPMPGTLPNGKPSAFPAGTVGVYIRSSNQKEFQVSRAQVRAHFLGTSGTLAQRRAATILWLVQQVEAALGAEMVPQGKVLFDFDETDGSPKVLELS